MERQKQNFTPSFLTLLKSALGINGTSIISSEGVSVLNSEKQLEKVNYEILKAKKQANNPSKTPKHQDIVVELH